MAGSATALVSKRRKQKMAPIRLSMAMQSVSENVSVMPIGSEAASMFLGGPAVTRCELVIYQTHL
jgi:hypothetical protein